MARGFKEVVSIGLFPAAELCNAYLYQDGVSTEQPTLSKLMHSADDTSDRVQPAEMNALLEVLLSALRDLDQLP